ncbi:MAG: rhomboid family intramembrane serine protease [Ignavibacteriales bacterium]|nr:rhomboid family intramembrane serine protease [Ignavibacteriales bacterium]
METTFTRFPAANIVMIAITVALFLLAFTGIPSSEGFGAFVLRDWNVSQMIGSLFLHGDFFHLLGNILFLWLFGNVINAAVGNIAYPILYLCFGMCAGVIHLSVDGSPAVGASGAINGIVGMALVLFPNNRVLTFSLNAKPRWLRIKSGELETKAIWLILAWNVFDFTTVFIGSQDGIGHWAHGGGLLFGVGFASLAVKLRLVETQSPSILDVVSRKSRGEEYRPAPIQADLTGFVQVNTIPTPPQGMPSVTATGKLSPPKRRVKVEPKIRLTQCVSNGAMVTCHIQNQGGPMKAIMLKVPKGVYVEGSTNALYTGQSGWIRFRTMHGVAIDSIEFMMSFKDSQGFLRKLRFRCLPAKKKLVEVERALESGQILGQVRGLGNNGHSNSAAESHSSRNGLYHKPGS